MNPNQLVIAYVDDVLLYTSESTFKETHRMIEEMMTKEDGIIEWSKDHNSLLKNSKLALIDFSHQNCQIIRLSLSLPHGNAEPTNSTKYLGVILDQHLS